MKKSLMLFAVFAALSCSMSQAAASLHEAGPALEKAYAVSKAAPATTVAVFTLHATERHDNVGLIAAHQSAPAPASFRLTETLARVSEPAQRPAIASSGPSSVDPARPERPSSMRQLT